MKREEKKWGNVKKRVIYGGNGFTSEILRKGDLYDKALKHFSDE